MSHFKSVVPNNDNNFSKMMSRVAPVLSRSSNSSHDNIVNNNQIVKAVKKGNIFIDQFDESNVRDNMYIFKLGKYYYKQGNDSIIVDSDNIDSIHKLWKGPFIAEKIDGKRSIIIPSKETILVHTEETLGLFGNCYSIFELHPCLVSCGLSVQTSFMDSGYISKYTCLLINNSKHKVIIPIGTNFLQCVFYNLNGNGNSKHKKNMKKSNKWHPSFMLPGGNLRKRDNIKTEIDYMILNGSKEEKVFEGFEA